MQENAYGPKYDLGNAYMFVIEGMKKVRRMIEENRKRKRTKHKKLSNNTVIEIDHVSPLELLKLQKNLLRIAVENYFIIHSYVSNDRTDHHTLIPVLEKQGILCLKISNMEEKEDPVIIQSLKSWNFTGSSFWGCHRLKTGINRQPHQKNYFSIVASSAVYAPREPALTWIHA